MRGRGGRHELSRRACGERARRRPERPRRTHRRATLSEPARSELARLGVSRAKVVGGTSAIGDGVCGALAGMGIAVERVAGADLVGTSVEIMREVRAAGSASDTVVVASGAGYADALSMGPWAYATASPLVLVGPDGLPTDDALAAIIADPQVKRVVVVGGTAVVGDVGAQLGDSCEIVRIAGTDRFETAARVAAWAADSGLGWRNPVVATGMNFLDALAGAAFAGHSHNVLLLVGSNADQAGEAIAAHKDAVAGITALGGEGAVSAGVVSQLEHSLT